MNVFADGLPIWREAESEWSLDNVCDGWWQWNWFYTYTSRHRIWLQLRGSRMSAPEFHADLEPKPSNYCNISSHCILVECPKKQGSFKLFLRLLPFQVWSWMWACELMSWCLMSDNSVDSCENHLLAWTLASSRVHLPEHSRTHTAAPF